MKLNWCIGEVQYFWEQDENKQLWWEREKLVMDEFKRLHAFNKVYLTLVILSILH